ncbi:hypothetical protein BGW38_004031 [Lunasporangiospora selenospora]|uniref:PNPLA domain-containing protein n=1 Tax=Lunasporangiospora selenospora TaxID=979761 RepID=A0A9P6FRW0_9FUNG|nr:hypothetical protein BGW38_004031 [Lunasporangiospora selenospora]
MSRVSPLISPTIDEDFDLCIADTNLPFPYSDHCSTGPPSLYEYEEDLDDEDEDEDDHEDDIDRDNYAEEAEEDSVTGREQVLLDNDEDLTAIDSVYEGIPPSRTARTSGRHTPKSVRVFDNGGILPNQLHHRLEYINNRTSYSIVQEKTVRPHIFRQPSSYGSNGGWHDDEDEEDPLSSRSQIVYPNQDEQIQDTGLVQAVTSAVTSVAYAVGTYWSKRIYASLMRSQDSTAFYSHLLEAATNYDQWAGAATALDRLQGKDTWKNDPVSPHYDYELLQERLAQLLKVRKTNDLASKIFLLRTSLSRNLGNVGRPQLYAHTIIGTKRLIEDYNTEVIRQLNDICNIESEDFSMAAKLEFFTHTRQAFGRTALLLSGGAAMGLIHIGVIKSLHESKLLPRIISGSSCGSIIAAILCTKTDEEIPTMLQFDRFNCTCFYSDEEKGDVLARLIHFLKNGALFDAQVLQKALKENIGEVTFQEAYNRTRRVLNVTVSTSSNFDMPRLLNYLTAPNVLIWSAVATSCAAPFIYNSAPLMAKDKNGEEVQWNPSRYHWIDGSVDNDLPMNKLSELFNVNHFIVCQVNPYIVPFLQNSLARSPVNRALGWMLYQARSEIQHRLNQLSILGVTPGLIHKTQAIMSQRYYGDITIVPCLDVEDYINIVTNPTVESLVNATLKGERATWPKISIIKNHCSIEHTLDDIIYRLRLSRFEAHRPFPQTRPAMNSVPRESNGARRAVSTLSKIHSSTNTATLKGSASMSFGAIGRSNSSPATPSNTSTRGGGDASSSQTTPQPDPSGTSDHSQDEKSKDIQARQGADVKEEESIHRERSRVRCTTEVSVDSPPSTASITFTSTSQKPSTLSAGNVSYTSLSSNTSTSSQETTTVTSHGLVQTESPMAMSPPIAIPGQSMKKPSRTSAVVTSKSSTSGTTTPTTSVQRGRNTNVQRNKRSSKTFQMTSMH